MQVLHTTVFVLLSTGLAAAPGMVPTGRSSSRRKLKTRRQMASNASNTNLMLLCMFSPSTNRLFFPWYDLTTAGTIQENHYNIDQSARFSVQVRIFPSFPEKVEIEEDSHLRTD
jgi:hypothetical protein